MACPWRTIQAFTSSSSARLLEDYNPATYSAKRRELQTAFGARATTAIRLFDKAHDEQERPQAAAVRRGAH
jgi:hypothetical protein